MLGLGVIALGVALIGTFAAAWEGYKAWGPGAIAIIPVGLLVALFVPFGAYGVAVLTIVLFQKARTTRFAQIANPDVDEDDVADVFE